MREQFLVSHVARRDPMIQGFIQSREKINGLKDFRLTVAGHNGGRSDHLAFDPLTPCLNSLSLPIWLTVLLG